MQTIRVYAEFNPVVLAVQWDQTHSLTALNSLFNPIKLTVQFRCTLV